LPYIDLYGIPEAKTVYRGTFRYQNWCETFHVLKSLGLTSYDEYDLNQKSYAQFTAEVAGVSNRGNLKADIAEKLGISKDAVSLQAMDWLGLFSPKMINKESGSPFDVLSDLMIDRMMIDQHERDMVIMQHSLKVRWSDGKAEKIRCRFIDFGDEEYTSIAKTVAWPAAIAVKLILDGKLKRKGVQIPTEKKIYEPVLKQLEELGIVMKEEFGLPT
jgi:saccharopine dehydrogenase-like NADP-dependent oxidoreductase